MQAERFDCAVGQVQAVGVERREATHVDVPHVDRRLAADDPFGDQPARAARIGDARRIEAGADEIAGDLRRLAENEIAVEREAFRTVEQHPDLGGFEARRAMDRVFHQDLELVPVFRKQLEFELVGNARRIPRLGDRLEAAHHQPADFLLVVDEAVGVANDRQAGVTPAIGLVTM